MGKLTIICLILTLGITVACSRGDPVLPTQGLTPAQIQSAVFVEKQATLDLRPEDGTRSPRERFIDERFRFGEGWFVPDSGGRWALGERSTLSVYMSDPDDLSLLIECKGTEVKTLSVLVNGAQVGRIQSTSEWKVHIFELDVNILKPGVNLIEFTFERPPTRTAAQLHLGDPVTIIREMIGVLTPTAAHLEGILPAIQEIFPEASIYQDDVLNLPGVDVADVIRDPDAEDVGGGWQWESSASGSLSSKFRTIKPNCSLETFR